MLLLLVWDLSTIGDRSIPITRYLRDGINIAERFLILRISSRVIHRLHRLSEYSTDYRAELVSRHYLVVERRVELAGAQRPRRAIKSVVVVRV